MMAIGEDEMEMINRCLEITKAKRAELEGFDRRHAERKAMIEERRERRGEFGNRKERRRQAALERNTKERA